MNYEEAIKEFEKYLNNYDKINGSINLKIIHTFEVVRNSEFLAKKLKLDEEDITLSKIIALLHDIGRFEQIKAFGSFNENNLDHAEFGVKILFKNKLIRNFVKTDKYDEIIYKAIANHNKLKIEDNLTEKVLLHSKIIRDADKLDIFRVLLNEKLENIYPKIYDEQTINYESISPKIYKDFLNHKSINIKNRKGILDYWLCSIAFIYDLNYNESLIYIKEKDYINKMFNKIEYKNKITKEQMEKLRLTAIKYIEDKINLNEKGQK